MLSRKILDELRAILKGEYGRGLSDKEVFEIGTTLVGYFDLLAKIYYREKTNNLNGKNHEQSKS